MEKLYEKIVIIKIEILANPDDPTHHQTTIRVQKEMTVEEYKALIATMNYMINIKALVVKEFEKKGVKIENADN